MLGTVPQTINLTAPAPLALPLNPGAQTAVTAQSQGNVSGVNYYNGYNNGSPTISSVSNPATNSNIGLNPNALTVTDVSQNGNSTESAGTLDPLNSGGNKSLSSSTTNSQATPASSSNSFLNPSNIASTANKLYGLLSGTGGLNPLSTSSVANSAIAGIGTSSDAADSLLSGLDTSAIGGTEGGLDALSGSAVAGSTASGLGSSAASADSLLAGIDTSALSSGTAAGSGILAGAQGALSAAAPFAAIGGAGLLSGDLIGGAIGSPGGGAAAGAASGAAEGALAGTYIFPGVGTLAGGVVGGLAGLLSGIMGGQHPTVGPDGNTSIQGWNSKTNTPTFVSGQDNGGTASQSNSVATQGWDAVSSILKNLGGSATGAAGLNVGTYKGNYTINDPGTGVLDNNNPIESIGKNENANYFSSPSQAEAEFVAQQLNYIGTSGKATGLSQDQLSQLGKVTYQDIINGNIPGMTQTQANTTTTNGSTAGANGTTDWGVVGSQNSAANVPGFDRGGFVEGEGGPREDKVDAKLSNEEFVMPADISDRLGGGDGTNRDPEASKRGARSLVMLIDIIRGQDAHKYGRPKNVDGVSKPHFGLGGGMFMNAGPSDMSNNQNEFSQGGSIGQIIRNDNISTPASYDSKAICYGVGGLIPRPGNNSNNFADGGMTPWPNNSFSTGGLVHDNVENDVQQPNSTFKRKNSGYYAHGIAQELGKENNAAHMYADGGFVVDKYSKPTRLGSYAKDNYKKGGLIKKLPPTAPNANFYN